MSKVIEGIVRFDMQGMRFYLDTGEEHLHLRDLELSEYQDKTIQLTIEVKEPESEDDGFDKCRKLYCTHFDEHGGIADDPYCSYSSEGHCSPTEATPSEREIIDKIVNLRKHWNDPKEMNRDYINGAIHAYEDMLKSLVKEPKRPKVITLCGSTRFTKEMLLKQWQMTKQGYVVMSWCALPDGYLKYESKTHIADQEGVRDFVDEVHKRKIDLSDEILVLNIDGYIGESTRSEIDYAMSVGKVVHYLEPVEKECMSCHEKAEYLEIGDDGLYVCGDCAYREEKAKLNRMVDQ